MNITIECALCDVHFKKKVRLYYKNISIHLGAENIKKLFLKLKKKKNKYFKPITNFNQFPKKKKKKGNFFGFGHPSSTAGIGRRSF